MERFFALVLRHRYVTLAVLLSITLFFAAQIPRARLSTDLTEMFVEDQTVIDEYKTTVREFGSDELILVAFEASDLFTADGLRRLAAASEELEALPDIERVLAIATANRIQGTEEALIVRPYIEEMEETPAWLAAMRAEVVNHPLYRDVLISSDGTVAAVIIELTVDDTRPGEALITLSAEIERILAQHHVGTGTRHQLGFPVNVASSIRESTFTIGRVLPVTLLTVAIVAWLLFRALWPTLLTLGVAGLAVVWVVGFAILLSPDINLLVAITPIVILVLSFADVVHLTNAYLTAITDGYPKEEAVLRTATDVGPACLFTSLTTLLGFGSFATVPMIIMRRFALILGFGAAAALLIAVTLVPALFAICPAPRPRPAGAGTSTLLDRFLRLAEWLVFRHGRAIAVVAVAATLVCLYTASRLQVEFDFVHRFRASHPLQQAHAFVQKHLASPNAAEILIQKPEPDGVYDPAFLRAVEEMQRQVLALPAADSAIAFTDLLEVVHRELNPATAEPGDLPDTRELAAQYTFLYELGDQEDLLRFVNYDRNRLRMAVRLDVTGMQETYDAARTIEAIGRKTLPPETTVSATGLMVIFGDLLQSVVRAERNAVITAIITITGAFLIAFRSVRVAFGGMLVNFLPLLIFFGTIHWFDAKFDTDYIVIACICLGIAVDDTIHFLHRYRIEIGRTGGDVDAAIRRTFAWTGKPIVQTTLIVVLGFASFNLCSYSTARAFGGMLGLALIWALLSDLLLLPVLIRSGVIRVRA